MSDAWGGSWGGAWLAGSWGGDGATPPRREVVRLHSAIVRLVSLMSQV